MEYGPAAWMRSDLDPLCIPVGRRAKYPRSTDPACIVSPTLVVV